MYAGITDVGAEEAWWTTGLELELCQLLDIPISGMQLLRGLVYDLAKIAGMPAGILHAYCSFQEDLHLYNAAAGGLGMPYQRITGIPQGVVP